MRIVARTFAVRLTVFGAFVLALAGCGGSGPDLYPVTGKVLFEDQPAEGATVVFQPVNSTAGALMPGGVVGSDGSFTLSTHPHGTGAPAGQYVVVVTWLAPQANPNDGGDRKSRVPLRYTNPSQSGLKAEVKAGDNMLEPFKLTKK